MRTGSPTPRQADSCAGLWATGESKENEHVARMIGHNPFDASYLIEQFLGLE